LNYKLTTFTKINHTLVEDRPLYKASDFNSCIKSSFKRFSFCFSFLSSFEILRAFEFKFSCSYCRLKLSFWFTNELFKLDFLLLILMQSFECFLCNFCSLVAEILLLVYSIFLFSFSSLVLLLETNNFLILSWDLLSLLILIGDF